MRVLLVVLGLLLAGSANAACSDADKAVLEKFDREWSVAWSGGDRAALERIHRKVHADLTPSGCTDRKSGNYSSSGTDAQGKAFKRKGCHIDAFVMRDGRWRIQTSQLTPIAG